MRASWLSIFATLPLHADYADATLFIISILPYFAIIFAIFFHCFISLLHIVLSCATALRHARYAGAPERDAMSHYFRLSIFLSPFRYFHMPLSATSVYFRFSFHARYLLPPLIHAISLAAFISIAIIYCRFSAIANIISDASFILHY
jgi:hypothetical protein